MDCEHADEEAYTIKKAPESRGLYNHQKTYDLGAEDFDLVYFSNCTGVITD